MRVDREASRHGDHDQDRGPGVSDADRDRLFRRFERGAERPSGEGSGLGLYVSRELCRAMDGDLVLEPPRTAPARRSRSRSRRRRRRSRKRRSRGPTYQRGYQAARTSCRPAATVQGRPQGPCTIVAAANHITRCRRGKRRCHPCGPEGPMLACADLVRAAPLTHHPITGCPARLHARAGPIQAGLPGCRRARIGPLLARPSSSSHSSCPSCCSSSSGHWTSGASSTRRSRSTTRRAREPSKAPGTPPPSSPARPAPRRTRSRTGSCAGRSTRRRAGS